MKNSQKKASESIAVQTKMVLPNDTNPLNTLNSIYPTLFKK